MACLALPDTTSLLKYMKIIAIMHNYNFVSLINCSLYYKYSIFIHSLFTYVGFLPSISDSLAPQENLPPYPQQFNNGAPYPH